MAIRISNYGRYGYKLCIDSYHVALIHFVFGVWSRRLIRGPSRYSPRPLGLLLCYLLGTSTVKDWDVEYGYGEQCQKDDSTLRTSAFSQYRHIDNSGWARVRRI